MNFVSVGFIQGKIIEEEEEIICQVFDCSYVLFQSKAEDLLYKIRLKLDAEKMLLHFKSNLLQLTTNFRTFLHLRFRIVVGCLFVCFLLTLM